MVEVNGSMVPPFGEARPQKKEDPKEEEIPKEKQIHYTEVGQDNQLLKKQSKEKERTLEKGEEQLRSTDKMPETLGKNTKDLGDISREGKQNASLSKLFNDCDALVLMHVHLQSKGGCNKKQLSDTMKEMENAARMWDDEKVCEDDAKTKTCRFKLRLVWHDNPSHDVINIRVNCKKGNPKKGKTVSGADKRGESAYIEVSPPERLGDSEGYYGHELGHNLFGTARLNSGALDPESVPAGWDGQGHNPKGGFMRDTETGGGIKPGEKPTREDRDLLYARLGWTCKPSCCPDNKKQKQNVIILGGGERPGSSIDDKRWVRQSTAVVEQGDSPYGCVNCGG